jgi:hypothetical protein
MTLSNFNWTDKTSPRWFILLPTGHEGPYALSDIESRLKRLKISPLVKIWAEGLSIPLTLKEVLDLSQNSLKPTDVPSLSSPQGNTALDLTPPPIPEDALSPTSPIEEITEEAHKKPLNRSPKVSFFAAGIIVFILGFSLYQWLKGQEAFSIKRYPKMSLETHERIQSEFTFKGWDKKIFFKEFVPPDLSVVWFITESFQECQVEAQFQSMKGKILSLSDDEIRFKSMGVLQDHVVEFKNFEFINGTKILPGMYEVDVRAYNCVWSGFAPQIGNVFKSADPEYITSLKVILFDKGPREFNHALENFLRKKNDLELKNQNQEELFWQGLQEKLQTLVAISLQIEQHLLDLLDKNPKSFQQNLKPSIDLYTRKFGHFLTRFVISNEEYFKELDQLGPKGLSAKRNYELMVRLSAKKVGLESMKIIEELQSLKNPSRKQLGDIERKLKSSFKEVKEELNQKIIQVSEDRS